VTSPRVGNILILPLQASRSTSAQSEHLAAGAFMPTAARTSWRLGSFTETTSPARTVYDGMLTFLPLMSKCPCRTMVRASARELAKPSRYVTLSSRLPAESASLTGDAFGARGLGESAAKLFFRASRTSASLFASRAAEYCIQKTLSALAMLSRR